MKNFTLVIIATFISFFATAQSQDYSDITKDPFKTETNTFYQDDVKVEVRRLYPNPAIDILNVELEGPSQTLIYEIVTMNGQLVQRGLMEGGRIQVGRLAQGMHVLRLYNENKEYAGAWKFIKG